MRKEQYVVFRLGKEEYCVNIRKVNEISEFKECSKVPNAPYFVDGIINLRGEIIPIINLKKRFNMDLNDINKDSRILVINIIDTKIGFVVDEASEVLSINEDNIDLPPEIIAGKEKHFIAGIGKYEDRILIILDLEKIINNEEKVILDEMNLIRN